MNDTMMTITGNLVDAPKLRRTKSGHCIANFRVASTPRRFDREKQTWVDGDTLFVTVSAWRALGENVAQSLGKGMPVIVTGRYYQREYTQDETLHTAYELDATAVGPDLSRGVATFERVSRSAYAASVQTDEDGIPADASTAYLDLDDGPAGGAAGGPEAGAGDVAPAGVDPRTGEVRELAAAS